MRVIGFIKVLLVVAALACPLLLAAASQAESGAHRGGGQPTGDVRTR